MNEQVDLNLFNNTSPTFSPDEHLDEHLDGQGNQSQDQHLPGNSQSIDSNNANQYIDDQGRGKLSGELIGPGVPGAGGSEFEAKIEALYGVYGPDMTNAALQQNTTIALLAQAEQLITDMEKQGVLSPQDADIMRDQLNMTLAEAERMPVTDAEGNILFDDLNGNGKFDEGTESPLMVSADALTDVENSVDEEINSIAAGIGQQWRQELADGNGELFTGTLGLPSDELGDNSQGEVDNIGESGEDYGDSVFTLTDDSGNVLTDENGEPKEFYLGDSVAPDDIREDVQQNGGEFSSDNDTSKEVSMHIVDDVQDDMRKDGRGKGNDVGNANNSGGGGGDEVAGDGSEGVEGGAGTEEAGESEATGGTEEAGESGGGEDSGMSSNLSTNNWLVILASALGQTSGKHLKAMLDTGKELGSVDSKENPELFAQLNAEFSAESQIFKMFQEAISTVVKSIGEGMSAVARKS